MKKSIAKHGNSAALPLSKDMLALLGVEPGDDVEIRFEGREMIVTPATRRTTVSSSDFEAAMNKVINSNAEVLQRLAR